MSQLSCYVTTFNCGRNLLDVDFFANYLFNGTRTSNETPPDILVLNLQEIAPIAHSFIGGTFIAPYFSRYVEAIRKATIERFGPERQDEYELIASENVGMVAIMVFVRRQMQTFARDIEIAGVGVGYQEMGNKGAVGVRLHVSNEDDDTAPTRITFVAAHLAPGEEACDRRNLDWRGICEGLVFERKHNSRRHRPLGQGARSRFFPMKARTTTVQTHRLYFLRTSHIFFAGDLNYRTADSGPQPTDFSTWPSSTNDITAYTKLLQRESAYTRTKRLAAHCIISQRVTFPSHQHTNIHRLHRNSHHSLRVSR